MRQAGAMGLTVAATLGLLGLTTIGAPPSAAAGTFSISGHVLEQAEDGSWQDANYGFVTATEIDGHSYTGGSMGQVNGGQFTITGLAPGHYKLNIYAHTGSPSGARVWAPNVGLEREASVVTVTNADVSGVQIQRPFEASISGTIDSGSAPFSDQLSATAFLRDPLTGLYEYWSYASWQSSNGAYTIHMLPAGDYILRFSDRHPTTAEWETQFWPGTTNIADATVIHVDSGDALTGYDAVARPVDREVTQLAGVDRFDTSVLISQAAFEPGVPTVLVANGLNYPDALAAGPAAATAQSPLLLVRPDSIPTSVAQELDRLNPTTIVIVGGPGSVSEGVRAGLAAYVDNPASVSRIGGTSRFDTSRQLAETYFDSARMAFVATGLNYPDALAAGAVGASIGAPVILVDGAASADLATRSVLSGLGVETAAVVGGTPSVSWAFEQSLRDSGAVTTVVRRAGESRYMTMLELQQDATPVIDTVLLAVGTNYPDALAGAPLAAALGAHLYLVQPNCVPQFVLDTINYNHPNRIILLGGEGTLGPGVKSLSAC